MRLTIIASTLVLLLTAVACVQAQPRDDPQPATGDGPVVTQQDGVKRITIKAGQRVTSVNARCSLSDVETDDLGDDLSHKVPGGEWTEIRKGDGRCGDDMETLAFRLHNCERVARDLPPFACDERMVWLGRQHALDMKKHNIFGHKGHDGSSPFDRMKARGIKYRAAAENVCQAPDVEQAHFVWMDSDGHRKNILSEQFSYAGIGIVKGKDGLLLATEFFDTFPE